MAHILVTGGAGYIGTHTTIELIAAGFDVSIADNNANSSPGAVQKVREITGKDVPLFTVDLCDAQAVNQLFEEHSFDAVVHFAGLKAVGESVEDPLNYYRVNLLSLINVTEAMKKHDVFQLVFSSSAAVYGEQTKMPITEDASLTPASPYGRTKAMCEQILTDLAATDDRWQITMLRYFNPVGAHVSGKIGENPKGKPSNLLPIIAGVADGTYAQLQIFGNDYPTRDGTCIRDYIHVVDLALGHIAALAHTVAPGKPAIYNLGSGNGYSVKEMLEAFEKTIGKPINHQVTGRRAGDPAESYSDISKAKEELNWQPQKTLDDICADAWRWQQNIA